MTVCTYWPGINDMKKAYTQSDSMGTTLLEGPPSALNMTLATFAAERRRVV